MWKEAGIASFAVPFRHLPCGTEEKHKILRHHKLSPGSNLKAGVPEYEEILLISLRDVRFQTDGTFNMFKFLNFSVVCRDLNCFLGRTDSNKIMT